MFFSTYVLTKKGPLAKIWLAAHWDRKLTRNEVRVVNLSEAIVHIVKPVVPIALRTSGELLVGVVKIYAIKVKHLLKDASDATLLLRVTHYVNNNTNNNNNNVGAEKKGEKGFAAGSVGLEGTLIHSKGEMEAVTFDWDNNNNNNNNNNNMMLSPDGNLNSNLANLAMNASAADDARFDAIADLLYNNNNNNNNKNVDDDNNNNNNNNNTWYVVQPSSQHMEDSQRRSQKDYDEIARMRADLMAFGERASGNSSSSKSKSSLGDIERGRGSAADGGAAADVNAYVPYPAVLDGLDLGIALPDDINELLPSNANLMDENHDPFALPNFPTDDNDNNNNNNTVGVTSRRKPVVTSVDLRATTLTREEIERWMTNRTDITNTEPRRGPLNTKEEQDRFSLDADSAILSTTNSNNNNNNNLFSVSRIVSPALQMLYSAALAECAAQLAASEEAARQAEAEGRLSELAAGNANDFEDFQQQQQLNNAKKENENEEENNNNNNNNNNSLSNSARETLERIATYIREHDSDASHRGQRSAAGRKRRRDEDDEDDNAALVGKSCVFSHLCTGLRRREAARNFVNVLSLASRELLGVRQAQWEGQVEITIKPQAVATLAA